MGRSIALPTDPVATHYFPVSLEYPEDWDELIGEVRDACWEWDDTLEERDDYDRECHTILGNARWDVVLSTHGFLAAVSIVETPDTQTDPHDALSKALERTGFELYDRLGGMSDGTSVYKKKGSPS